MAHGHQLTEINDPGGVGLPAAMKIGAVVAIIAGLLLVLVSFLGDPLRAWQGVLAAYMYFLMLALGGLVFTAIQYCANARWSIVVRRFAEGMAWFGLVGFVVFLLIAVFGYRWLYDLGTYYETSPIRASLGKGGIYYTDGGNDLIAKSAWLSQWGVLIKGVVFYAVVGFAGLILLRNSAAQDKSKDPKLKAKNIKVSIVFLLVMAYLFSIHAIDMLQALEGRWFSTMFGVYCFCGMFLSSLCVLALLTLLMRKRAKLHQVIQHRHLYDIGTWIMAFSCFMAYIGFSQYMLIWYANIPEETFYLIERSNNGWQYIFVLLPLLKWVVPFAVLMPQGFRGNPTVLTIVAFVVLGGQWLDMYWLIYPTFNVSPVMPALAELGPFLALLGAFGLTLNWAYSRHSILAMGDQHLLMSANGSYL